MNRDMQMKIAGDVLWLADHLDIDLRKDLMNLLRKMDRKDQILLLTEALTLAESLDQDFIESLVEQMQADIEKPEQN